MNALQTYIFSGTNWLLWTLVATLSYTSHYSLWKSVWLCMHVIHCSRKHKNLENTNSIPTVHTLRLTLTLYPKPCYWIFFICTWPFPLQFIPLKQQLSAWYFKLASSGCVWIFFILHNIVNSDLKSKPWFKCFSTK